MEVDKSDKDGKEPKTTLSQVYCERTFCFRFVVYAVVGFFSILWDLQEQASADSGLVLADLFGQEEALRLKTLAEQKYAKNNIQSALKYAKRAHKLKPSLEGLSEMITAFKILSAAATPIFPATTESTSIVPPDYYRILQLERFSHINSIKKQYKKLALTLHPDKNPLPASEEAFKFVGEAVRVLSDKIRRKEYDMRLRIVMQSQTEGVAGVGAETFWTACSACRLLHKFERIYMGHSLMCPRCKKCFKAVEVKENPGIGENVEDMEVDEGVGAGPTRISARIQERLLKGEKVGLFEKFDLGTKRTISSVRKPLESPGEKVERYEDQDGAVVKGLRLKRVEDVRNSGENGDGAGLTIVGKSSSGYGRSSSDCASRMPKRAKVHEEETMTLAQMQTLIKQKKADVDKLGLEKKKDNNEKHKEAGDRKKMTRKSNNEKLKAKGKETKEKKMLSMNVNSDSHSTSKDRNLEVTKKRASKNQLDMEIEALRASKKGDLVIMRVEDSEFHDFDNSRKARSFKKGQVWAVYDDDDGMPRHYALINDVSVNPFEVSLSWLELEYKGDEELMLRQKMGCISCGRFKVSRKVMVKYRNLFSHIVDNERAARALYRIYPKKGSIWALYIADESNTERGNLGVENKRCYNIIISLSSYSDIHGLSIALLEKVDGFRTVFKRREVGARAVQWLGKDDIKLFSHQIPAKKLSGDENTNLPKDCWELDPASLSL
ncbi:DNAJ heat shock N-terminal domain-containing protein [Dorcoceras hygrometricum]|uniref:DNAJ heat shock N-terminal domain-containing protein n=1 Tax=Dorcoceras hygrometricum TaxID=472368 RepID=A0A2Z7CIE3_9LAMI|nr:DNAJ heat shock N-terminal domain-containing protein [Dorcoceras hygrometricum]